MASRLTGRANQEDKVIVAESIESSRRTRGALYAGAIV
jgi:hypothetical protein